MKIKQDPFSGSSMWTEWFNFIDFLVTIFIITLFAGKFNLISENTGVNITIILFILFVVYCIFDTFFTGIGEWIIDTFDDEFMLKVYKLLKRLW